MGLINFLPLKRGGGGLLDGGGLFEMGGLIEDLWYCKIPKISPGAYIFQRPFLRGLCLEGLIFGSYYMHFKID